MDLRQTVAIDRDERLDEVVTAYLKAVESGQTVDRQGWLATHPDIAAELAEFFADEDRLHQVVPPPRIGPGDGTPQPTPGRKLTLAAPAALGRFGDYELLEEIARGGMGVVYRARQISVNRVVALKLILAGKHASAGELGRFHTEAEAAAQLDHPNIIPIYDVGENEGQPFFTMKLIEGGSLVQRLPCSASDWPALVGLLVKVARAVHYAHQRGILHRDLKPANILIEWSNGSQRSSPLAFGEPRITDFGLAKLAQRGSDLTRSGAIVGTPSYMAPEQARGRNRVVTTAADVYSLGAVLYEALTGQPPFRGETAVDTLLQVLEREPAHPRELNPQVNRDLATICMKCLEREPERRYESAEALAEDLENWLARRPIQARPATTLERAWKWARRERTKAALVAAIAAIVLLSAGGGPLAAIGWMRARALAGTEAQARDAAQKAQQLAEEKARAEEQANLEAQKARIVALDQKMEAEAARKDAVSARRHAEQKELEARANLLQAERRTYYGRIGQADSYWHAHNVPRVQQLLEQCSPELRGWEWDYLNRLAHRELLTWTGHNGSGVVWVTFSPEGKRIASLGWDKTVRIWDPHSGKVSWTHAADCNWGATVAFSPDGKLLAFPQSDNGPTVRLWDTEKNQEVFKLAGHQGQLLNIVFSADGKFLASADSNGGVKLWDAAKGQELLSIAGEQQGVWCLKFSPDSTRLAAGTGSGAVKVWDVAGGAEKLTFAGHKQMVHGIAYSPDGSRLATAGFDQTVKLWDAQTGKPLGTQDKHNGLVFGLAFSPDGKRLASTCCDQTVKVWDATTLVELFILGGHTRPVMCVAFSPTDDRIISASSDGSVRIWDSRLTDGSLAFADHAEAVASAAFMPDGKRIVTLAHPERGPGVASVIEVATGKTAFTLKDASGQAAVSPDGRYIAAATSKGTLTLWDARTGKQVRVLKGHTYRANCLAFSADSQLLASVSPLADPNDKKQALAEIKVWDVAGGEPRFTVRGHRSPQLADHMPVNAVAFSPDSTRLATAGSDGSARVWDAQTGRELFVSSKQAEPIRAVAFSPDGRLMAEAHGLFESRPQITFWDMNTAKEIAVLTGHSGAIYALAFTPDGKRLASASMDRTIKLWDVAQREELLTLQGHQGRVNSVAFSADGLLLVSAGQDKTARVWDATPVVSDASKKR